MDPDSSPTAAAILELIEAHYTPLFRYAYRLTGNLHDAEDLTQVAVMSALRHADQLSHPSLARPWLFAMLRNAFSDARRRSAARPCEPLSVDPADELPSAPPDEWDEERLRCALQALPPEFRVTLLMYYFEELSYKEIAERLQIPLGTVMSRLSRAKSNLRAYFATPRLEARP